MELLLIKNMVCDRCIMVVTEVLRKAGLDVESVSLGEARVRGDVSAAKRREVAERLNEVGFELLQTAEEAMVERVKASVRSFVSLGPEAQSRLSEFLADRLGRDYSSLSSLFSAEEGRTIEQYHISVRIERAKELLSYGEMTVGEVADALGFSSISHFSRQFKKLTGMSPSQFCGAGGASRSPVDKV